MELFMNVFRHDFKVSELTFQFIAISCSSGCKTSSFHSSPQILHQRTDKCNTSVNITFDNSAINGVYT